MKPKTMILMGLAVTCGLGASYMTSQLLAERQPIQEEEKIVIFVAKRHLSVGEAIKKLDEMVEAKAVAKDQEPPEAIKDVEQLKGKILKRGLRKGDHITPNDMMGDKDSLDIPEGYQAVGLRVNLESIASGFASLPLSRVDIIHTVRRGDDNSSYSQVLLQNVLVLAADLNINRDNGIAAPAQVVTFALKDEEILKVNLAKEMGILSLALRKPTDKSSAKTTKYNGAELTSGKQKEPETVVTVELPAKKEVIKPVEKVVVVEPKEEKIEPVVEAPKGVLQTLTIANGKTVERAQYRVSEDGREILSEESTINEPTVPRPANRNPSGAKKTGPREF